VVYNQQFGLKNECNDIFRYVQNEELALHTSEVCKRPLRRNWECGDGQPSATAAVAKWGKIYPLTGRKSDIISVQIPVRDDPLETVGLFFYEESNKILFKDFKLGGANLRLFIQ